MNKLLDFNRPEVNEYFDYLVLRSSIWHDKYIKGIDQDYKGDSILQRYKFCNIWRELDNFSKIEIERITGKSLKEQIKIITIGRHSISWLTTDLLLAGGDYNDLMELWEECKKTRASNFVSDAINFQPFPGENRAKCLILHRDEVLKELDSLSDLIKRTDNYSHILANIREKLPHIGPFRAYEIFTSLSYSIHVNFQEDSICHVGPGAIGGMNTLCNAFIPKNNRKTILKALAKEVKSHLLNIKEFNWIPKELQGSYNFKKKYKFTIRTMEDSLCEYRKYIGLKYGNGRRRIYNKEPDQLSIF